MVPRDLDYAGVRLKIISSRVVDDEESHEHEDGEHGHHPRPRHGHGHKRRHDDEYGEPVSDHDLHDRRPGHLKRDTPIFSKVSLRTYLPAT